MKNAKGKTTAVSLILLFAMAISLVALPTANAQSTKATYAFIGATPNPIGVNQETLLHVGITEALSGGVQDGWDGLSVTITRPDGVVETISNIKTDSTGGTGRVYVPTVAGNYTLQTHFPQQVYTYNNVTYLASDSDKLTLVVQEEPIKVYLGHPLPTEYWTRPINSQFREWYTVAGSWLSGSAGGTAGGPNVGETNLFAPYNDGPETPHVLWAKPLTTGGLAGGDLGLVGSGGTSVGMETGDAYEGKWSNRLILMGKLYYTAGAYDRPRLIHCVDLRTGEELWAKTFLDNQTIAMGQLFYWQSYNYQGTFAYLWVTVGTTWTAFDAFTGEWMATITDVPSGTNLIGSRGEIYRYTVNQAAGYMQLWNMSAFISLQGSWGSSFCLREYNASSGTYRSVASNGSLGSVVTSGAAARAARAWAFNITIPKGLPGSVRVAFFGDRIVGASITTTAVTMWGLSLKSGQEGTLLFNSTWNPPADWAAGNQSISWKAASLEDKVGILWSKELRAHYGFSLETGEYLWGPTPSQYYLDAWEGTPLICHRIAYGKLYASGLSGIVYCYDVQTGELLWTYEAEDPYTEILFHNDWWIGVVAIADGKLYLGHSEHSPNQPLTRGAPFICLNATTGEEIFRVDGLFRQQSALSIMGDGIIATYNGYDECVYAIGKGPSATTVTIENDVITHGSSVLVKGMVTDVSPGTKQTALTLRFPNGVPAVSDDSVGEWMKYVYQQFPLLANATGVEVVVSVLDPNNNFYEVGRATSDASGMFKKAFTPEVPGEYTIIASFAGSGAYYGSYAETAVNVEEAPVATPAPTPTPAPMTDTYVMGFGIAMIIAIVIGFALLLLRKR